MKIAFAGIVIESCTFSWLPTTLGDAEADFLPQCGRLWVVMHYGWAFTPIITALAIAARRRPSRMVSAR